MKMFSALGLVIVSVLLWVMMNSVFHALERTLLQFLTAIQDAIAIGQKFLATISF